MFQIVSINECKFSGAFLHFRDESGESIWRIDKFGASTTKFRLVNLAGEFMDVVLALTLEWQDPRLTWDPYSWGDTRITEV